MRIPIDQEKLEATRNPNVDSEYTREITCPYCGHEMSDSWEYDSGSEDLGEIECEECGKKYYATRNITIDYSTQTKETHDFWDEHYAQFREENSKKSEHK